MQAIAATHDMRDMRDIAAQYWRLPAPPAHTVGDVLLVEREQQIAQQQ